MTSSARATPPSPPLAHTSERATFTPQCAAAVLHQLQLRLGVGGETVNGHHTGQAVDLGDICHVLEQVGKAGLQGGQVFTPQLGFGAAPVVLEGADSSHHHHRIGVEPGQTALNIQELFRAQIGARSRPQ